jgi:hypothetical protein
MVLIVVSVDREEEEILQIWAQISTLIPETQ